MTDDGICTCTGSRMCDTCAAWEVDKAVEIVAWDLVAALVSQAIEIDLLDWSNYPDLGEHDWKRVLCKAIQAVEGERRVAYKWAYELLAKRAKGVDA